MTMNPMSNRPKITEKDVSLGYVMRYFVKPVSTNKVIEIDKQQYNTFKNNPFFVSMEMKWVIGGNDKNLIASDGQTIYGAGHRNEVSLDFYEKKMPGLKRILRNPLEYFSGKTI